MRGFNENGICRFHARDRTQPILAHISQCRCCKARAESPDGSRTPNNAQAHPTLRRLDRNRIPNRKRRKRSVAGLQNNFPFSRQMPTRQLKRIEPYIAKVRVADNVYVDVLPRSRRSPARTECALELHRLHIWNRGELRCQGRRNPVNQKLDIRCKMGIVAIADSRSKRAVGEVHGR